MCYDVFVNKSQTTQETYPRDGCANSRHRASFVVHRECNSAERYAARSPQMLAARSDVARVEGNPHIQKCSSFSQSLLFRGAIAASRPRQTIEPGIAYTHAPDVWALGFRGQGITI